MRQRARDKSGEKGKCMVEPKSLQRNRIQCRLCGDIIESLTRHDYKSCTCGKVSVDGGLDYARRVGNPTDIIELSVWG